MKIILQRLLPACLSLVLPLCAVWVPAGHAADAPQALAVVADGVPTPLVCDGADCVAELSTICLEERRGAPWPGTAYRAVAPAAGGLMLVGRRSDGTVIRRSANGLVSLTAARTYTAVQLSIPAMRLAELDLSGPELAVEGEVALLPVTTTGAADPEQAEALPGLRRLATAVLTGEPAIAGAVSLTARLIADLPARRRTGPDAAAATWRQVADASARDTAPGSGLALVLLDRCAADTALAATTLRQCLESAHDSLLGGLTRSYWRAARAQS